MENKLAYAPEKMECLRQSTALIGGLFFVKIITLASTHFHSDDIRMMLDERLNYQASTKTELEQYMKHRRIGIN